MPKRVLCYTNLQVFVQALLLCDAVMRDGQTGKAMLTGIFDRVAAQRFPAVHQKCAVYFRLQFDPGTQGKTKIQLVLQSPIGLRQPMPQIDVPIGDSGVSEGNLDIVGLPLQQPGTYEIELYVDGEKRSSFRLVVSLLQQPSEGGKPNANSN